MPKFQKLNPSAVLIGRGRAGVVRREPYRAALKASDAGRIDLERSDQPVRVRKDLRNAAHEVGARVRSSWEDKSQRVLLWKKVGK